MSQLSLPQLELELIDILRSQGLIPEDIRLIGLLGQGSRASAFSIVIDGKYHVLKVYDSRDSLRAELKNLRRMIPKDRFLFAWQEKVDGSSLNLAIIEVPEGRELNSSLINDETAAQIADRLTELYRLTYRQRVSVASLKENLARYRPLCLQHIKRLGLEVSQFEKLIDRLEGMLDENPDLFRIRKTRIHGDLWWPNIIVAKEDVYLIDWESVRRGDPAEDLAKLRLVVYWPRNATNPSYFWKSASHTKRLSRLLRAIVEAQPDAEVLTERLRFYLTYLCVYELAQRLVTANPSKVAAIKNHILAAEALQLIDDPLASPPKIVKDKFWQAINLPDEEAD